MAVSENRPKAPPASAMVTDLVGLTLENLSGVRDLRFIDIGSNLGDPVFRGNYHAKQVHPDDFEQILRRARSMGVSKQILTGDSLSGSEEVIRLAHQCEGLYATVGCHPCKAYEFASFPPKTEEQNLLDVSVHQSGAERYLGRLDALIEQDILSNTPKVVAIGECGLDYDRFEYCSREFQLLYFPMQLQLAKKHRLPLFLHSRHPKAHQDLVRILKQFHSSFGSEDHQLLPVRRRGVVHSFTGTVDEMNELVELGYSIGVNGCSLKTEDNLKMVQAIPLDRLLLETDCPWCEIRPSHASYRYLNEFYEDQGCPPSDVAKAEADDASPREWLGRCLSQITQKKAVKKERKVNDADGSSLVKSRNEPCKILEIGLVVARVKQASLEKIMSAAWRNSIEMFDLS